MFPLIEGEEFNVLVADIDEFGLTEPIVLAPDGETIVDGRNRYRACEKCSRDPIFRTLGSHYDEPLIVKYIISANLHRRHLDVGQRAFIGIEIKRSYAEAAEARRLANLKQNQESAGQTEGADSSHREEDQSSETSEEVQPATSGRSADQAADEVGVSATSLKQAERLDEEAPDLASAVKSGQMSLNAAYNILLERRQAAAEAEEEVKRQEAEAARPMLTLLTFEGQEVPYPEPKSKSTFNATNEAVSWAAWTWNPVTGCNHGCEYCYARELALKESFRNAYPVGFTPLFHHERLEAPANTKVPSGTKRSPAKGRVFVCSMADLYGKWVPTDWISQVHQSCINNPQWEYLFLTKFPARYNQVKLPSTGWMGTTVDRQHRVKVAETAFRKIEGVRVKWLSLEPLLEPLEFTDLSMFDWVIIGSQSQTNQPDGVVKSFAPNFEWVSRLTDQAHEAGCKVWLKENLLGYPKSDRPGMTLIQESPHLRE
jgi:protein gp37